MEDDFDKPKPASKGESLWLLSFSDMSLVLLCFFILLISTMTTDKKKFDRIKEGMSKEISEKHAESLGKLSEKLKKIIKKNKLDNAASIKYDSEGLHIEFTEGIVFRSSSAKFNPKKDPTINSVMKLIAKIGKNYQMNIQGHTDDTPIKRSKHYKSNWELSAARGFSLMRIFKKLGVPEKQVSVTAYAHTRPKVPYKELKSKKKLKAARAENRRVVIRID